GRKSRLPDNSECASHRDQSGGRRRAASAFRPSCGLDPEYRRTDLTAVGTSRYYRPALVETPVGRPPRAGLADALSRPPAEESGGGIAADALAASASVVHHDGGGEFRRRTAVRHRVGGRRPAASLEV